MSRLCVSYVVGEGLIAGEHNGGTVVRRWDAGTEACRGDAGGRRQMRVGLLEAEWAGRQAGWLDDSDSLYYII
jgi:hypothetical protein